MEFEKEFFKLDGLSSVYEGYTTGEVWNGWNCPYFAKNVVDKLIEEEDVKESYNPYFDEDKDCYVFEDQYNEYAEKEEVHGEDILYKGKIKHVYPIGYGSWIWETYTLDEIRECELKIVLEEK